MLLVSFGAAYLVFPLIRELEKYRVPRLFSVSILFLVLSSALTLVMLLVVPALFSELQEFVKTLPELGTKALARFRDIIVQFNLPLPLYASQWPEFISSHLNDIFQNVAPSFLKSVTGLLTGATSALVWIMNVVLVPIFFFYLVLDYEKIWLHAKNLLPRSWENGFIRYTKAADQVLAGFVRGQLLVCLCLAIGYGGGLHLVGVQFGLLIGVIGGILSFIPYVGGAFCLLAATIVSLATGESWGTFVGFVAVFSVVQSFESFYLTPKMVGNKVGLNPFFALLVLIAGANLMGFWGLILALPIGGMAKFALTDLLSAYRRSMFYRSL